MAEMMKCLGFPRRLLGGDSSLSFLLGAEEAKRGINSLNLHQTALWP